MQVGGEGGFEGGFGGEVLCCAAGEGVVAFDSEGAGTAGELVEAEAVEGVEGMGGGDGLGGGDGTAFGGAAAGGSGGDGGWVKAEEVADVVGEFGIGEEGSVRDAVGEEEGCSAPDSTRSNPGDSMGASMGVGGLGRVVGEAVVEVVSGKGMGEDRLGMAVMEKADVGDGGGVGAGVEKEGVDGGE